MFNKPPFVVTKRKGFAAPSLFDPTVSEHIEQGERSFGSAIAKQGDIVPDSSFDRVVETVVRARAEREEGLLKTAISRYFSVPEEALTPLFVRSLKERIAQVRYPDHSYFVYADPKSINKPEGTLILGIVGSSYYLFGDAEWTDT